MTQTHLLVLDIDGTIAGQSNQVSEAVKEAIQVVQERGIQVALATGRMYCSALRFHQSIKSQLPIVAYNGAWIQNPRDGQICSHIPVPKQVASELLAYFKQPQWRSQVEVHFYLEDRLYVEKITAQTEDYSQRSQVEAIAVGDLSSLLDSDPTKVLALSSHASVTQQLAQNLPQRYQTEGIYLTQSNPIYLEATHASVNKGTAIQYLAEKMIGITSEQVMAIGDNFNDLTMLEYAGISVAMGNAPQAVKDTAEWVAPDVEEDGVAVAIEKFLL
jgi:Cof subfamily protein (haloacid dehalogenase superfamily)